MYEHHRDRLLSQREFMRRLIRHGGWAVLVLVVSLVLGTVGFHYIADQSWIDAWLNSAMLLGGMGPIGDFGSDAGKLFASIFALYAGIAFLAGASILLAPMLHRMLHRFHLQ